MTKLSANRLAKLRLVLWVLGLLVLGVLAIQSLLIKDLYARTDQLKEQELKTVLIDAVQSRITELAVEPQTGKRFIPAARVVFPAKSDGHILYQANAEVTSLWLVDASNRRQAIHKLRAAASTAGIFSELKDLQKCTRQLIVSFNLQNPTETDDKLTLKATKKLADGRLAYVYQNDCPYGAESLLRSVDQMQSF